ncbi:UNVERIFIED_CONTAM: hypothetical protein Sradi_1214600 [Sesamum radiatum]|uniref:Mitochondrial import inner membrane translocase subunit Tim17/Tim22/Tim23 family protein n=1 Tax=Sesamum radiatum TaxID=300843 RepID=A0AAW2ULG6_SESRA
MHLILLLLRAAIAVASPTASDYVTAVGRCSSSMSFHCAREFVRVSRTGKPDDLLNSVIGGFGSGAILGRLQGGQLGAVRYSVVFAVVGTAVDYATLKLKPAVSKFTEKKDDWLKLPEWSPIKVLDDEAVAAKRAREQQIYRNVHNLNKEES